MPTNTHTAAIIGAGRIAHAHLDVLRALPRVTVQGIANTGSPRARKLADEYDIPHVYADYKKMIADIHPDIVYILVPPSQSCAIASDCIAQNIHCFIEKPAGMNAVQTAHLARLAQKHHARCAVGTNRRFYSILDAGLAAAQKAGLYAIHMEGSERPHEIADPEIARHLLVTNSIHTIDLWRYLCGGSCEVLSALSQQIDADTPNSFVLHARAQANMLASYISHWRSPGGWSIDLFAKDLRVSYSPLEAGAITHLDGTTDVLEPSAHDKNFKPGFWNMHHAFIEYVATGIADSRLATLADSAQTMQMIDAIKEQLYA